MLNVVQSERAVTVLQRSNNRIMCGGSLKKEIELGKAL